MFNLHLKNLRGPGTLSNEYKCKQNLGQLSNDVKFHTISKKELTFNSFNLPVLYIVLYSALSEDERKGEFYKGK